MKDELLILGLISGSSLDGLDIGLSRFAKSSNEGIRHQLIKAKTFGFRRSLQEQLKEAPSLSIRALLKLEVAFSRFCVRSIRDFCQDVEENVDYIASHGHTIVHHPEDSFTLQIGLGSMIAEETTIPCISDFRSNDMALGGQGAPVAPIVEKYLYPGYDYYFNLGGIANLSAHSGTGILSIDSCPCNQVLNFIMNGLGKSFDNKGLTARRGRVHESLIESWSDLDYFHGEIPKSMDNTWVKNVFIPVMEKTQINPEDKLATMIEFIAKQLAHDIRKLALSKEPLRTSGLVTGGGALNDFLVERMQVHFNDMNLQLSIPDKETIEFKEAILMGLMGFLRVHGMTNTISSVTGARKSTIGGAIYLPSPEMP